MIAILNLTFLYDKNIIVMLGGARIWQKLVDQRLMLQSRKLLV